MNTAGQSAELRAFHEFLASKLTNGAPELTPEEALDEWRRLNPNAEAEAQELAAIKEALDDVANGDYGMPFAQFDREFRARHFPAKP